MTNLIATNEFEIRTAQLRLMQLSSAALPVGAYAFSMGLEYAVESGLVKSKDDSFLWLKQQIFESLVRADLPILICQLDFFEKEDADSIAYWNQYLLACRETKELRLSDTATGKALKVLLVDLGVDISLLHAIDKDISFVTSFACACYAWHIDAENALTGFLWSWLENQVAAATKLVPLGQVAAQQLLSELLQEISAAHTQAYSVNKENIGGSMPALAMVSSWHENQYSRLFRS